MDFIPHPRKKIVPLLVPFLYQPSQPGKYDYSERGNHNYFPKNHKYIPGAKFSDRTAEEIASFAQTFLYFGLLSDTFEENVEPTTLATETVSADGKIKKILSSKELKERILRFQMGELYKTARPTHFDWLFSCASWNLSQLERICSPIEEPLPTVLLSIGVLIETLATTCYEDWNLQLPTPFGHGDQYISASGRLLESIMKKNGWCYAQSYQALCTFPYCLAYYLSQMDRRHRRPGEDHKLCPTERCTIEGCTTCTTELCVTKRCTKKQGTTELCTALVIDPKTYKTVHARGCRSTVMPKSMPKSISKSTPAPTTTPTPLCCEPLECINQKIEDIVKKDGIPIVCVKRNQEGNIISLEATKAEYGVKYVAISHAWLDGMGNGKENYLPRCQLERISKYVSEIPWLPLHMTSLMSFLSQGIKGYFKPEYFWLDTLCIPMDKDLKKKAIHNIPAVYSGAYQVLVLDSEMEEVRLEDSHWPEVAGRLVFSAWIGRCWTLEEAGFSQICRVKVADGYFDPSAVTHPDDMFQVLHTNPFLGRNMRRALLERILRASYDWAWPNERQILGRKFDHRLNRTICQPLEHFFHAMFTRGLRKPSKTQRELLLDQFVYTWNSLDKRQTTVEEDRLRIFVHMLDLNPIAILGSSSARLSNNTGSEQEVPESTPNPAKPPTQRETMQNVLISFSKLPLALFADMPNLNPIKILGSLSARLSKPPGSQEQAPQEQQHTPNLPKSNEFTQGEKMQRTLISFSELPLDLLYDHGPRAQDDGLGWVPLNPGMQRLHANSLMTLDDHGLHFDDLVYSENDQGRSEEYIKLFKLDLSTVNRQKLVLTSRSLNYNYYASKMQEAKEVKQEVGEVKQEVGEVKQEVGKVKQEVGEVKQEAKKKAREHRKDKSRFKGKNKRTFQSRKEDVWNVEFLRPPKDFFAINKLTTLAIVCEYQKTSGLEIQGACLQVIPRVCACPKFEDFDTPLQHLEECKWRTHGLYCSYVCPVRILPSEEHEPEPKDILRAGCSNILHYKVTLECDTHKKGQYAQRRPPPWLSLAA